MIKHDDDSMTQCCDSFHTAYLKETSGFAAAMKAKLQGYCVYWYEPGTFTQLSTFQNMKKKESLLV